MVLELDQPISVICNTNTRPREHPPSHRIHGDIMASARVASSHARSRIRSRHSTDEKVSRRDTSPPPPTPQPEINGSGPDVLEKMAAEKIKYSFRLDDLEIKNTLGTGTFGRVVLVQHKRSKDFYALKILNISDIIRLKQVEHVRSEKAILQAVANPFIVDMLWTFHNDRFLYMLLDFVCGGELFSYLRNAGRFNNATSNFYAAEITSALEYLHAKAIVYRDLKPENLLLDREGHLKLTDFGFAKLLEDRTWTLCGTPEYLAPEIIQSKGHNKAVDWWALGILIYEMIVGYPPFFDDKPFGIYEKILAGKIEWPKHMDTVAKDLIRKLLIQDRTKRLGNMKNGAEDVKNHKWFRLLRWDVVSNRKLDPPIVPNLDHEGDTKNFDKYSENNWHMAKPAAQQDIALFHDF